MARAARDTDPGQKTLAVPFARPGKSPPMPSTHPLLAGLNPAQREAVAATARHLLVLAGAGSGKTRVLVHRIAWLIDQRGLSPHAILAVTFTNKAAGEMRHRLADLLGFAVGGMWVGTFHGLAHRFLRLHWLEAGLPESFQIMDSDDQLRLVKRVQRELNLDETRWPAKQAQWFINASKDEGQRAAHIREGGDLFLRTMKQVYTAYEDACARGGLVDFAELLLRSLETLRGHESLRHHYRTRFRHVLVDEFQDTNAVQYDWLREIAGDDGEVTVVGDDDQSIYGWRGARVENIRQFNAAWADVATVRLEQNYRSTATILKAANQVIENNDDRLGKNLWTEGHDGEPIALYVAFNETDEARYVVDEISRAVQQGRARREIAVLYRNNAQSRVLEEALLRAAIPYRIYGGQRFFERAEIRNATAYLRLVENRHADAAFERVVNVPPRGIGEKTLQAVRDNARLKNVSLWTAARALIDERGLPARAAGSVQGFCDLVDALADAAQGQELPLQVERVLAQSGLIDFHRHEKGERGEQRVENLQELVTAARQFLPDEGEPTLAAFLDHAALEAGDAQAEVDEDAVQLMTLHSAKGLEFPVVFLVGLEEGVFPGSQSNDDPGRLAEERRLCYVGITRAMQKLVLTRAESRRLYGTENYNAPSRFLREIPPELLNEVRLTTTRVSRPLGGGTSASFPFATRALFRLGQRVRHPSFGEGVVLQCEGGGAGARVTVNFADSGAKTLIAQYARLETID
jgi:DNA helicase-2/ATP-dependent DNA helicase PcrA